MKKPVKSNLNIKMLWAILFAIIVFPYLVITLDRGIETLKSAIYEDERPSA